MWTQPPEQWRTEVLLDMPGIKRSCMSASFGRFLDHPPSVLRDVYRQPVTPCRLPCTPGAALLIKLARSYTAPCMQVADSLVEHAACTEDESMLGSSKPGSLPGRHQAALLAAPKFVLLDFRWEDMPFVGGQVVHAHRVSVPRSALPASLVHCTQQQAS